MKTASLLLLSASVALTSITVVAAMFSGIATSLGQHHSHIRPDDSDADAKKSVNKPKRMNVVERPERFEPENGVELRKAIFEVFENEVDLVICDVADQTNYP